MAFAAEVQVNWMSRTLGAMMIRPGFGYITGTYNNLATRNIPFVRSASTKVIIELTENVMRVIANDSPITRAAVSTAVTNGNFTSNLNGWTDNDESGAASAWNVGGFMALNGTGTNAAIRDQTVAVAVADRNVVHALKIHIVRGPAVLRVGTSTSDDSYINETELQTGWHSLAFTPSGNFNIRLMNSLERTVYVSSCNIESAGAMTITTPWAAADLDNVRAGPDSQSVDVLFVACMGYTQRRIERRGAESWSVVQYLANDGPFRTENISPTTLTPSGLTGNVTITASTPLFRSGHAPSANNAGALFRIASEGQRVAELNIAAQDTFSDAIRVTGIESARVFSVIRADLAGTGSTATLQRSLESDAGPWEDVTTYTTNGTTSFDDGLDNQIAWYRIGIKTGDYGGGSIDLTLDYPLGSITGVVRVTSVTSSTVASVEVLSPLGGLAATEFWSEGEWSEYRGWPSAGCLYESRLCWVGLDKEWGSITDAFDSLDPDFEGDAGPISRSIGSGPVETLNWIVPLQRLMIGGLLSEFSCRSSNFDEPLTPTNFNIKPSSGQGSATVQAVKVDDGALFVQRGGVRLFELEFSPETYNYRAKDLCQLVPEIGRPRIVRVAVQRQPDTRIHCVLSNGTVAVLVFDKLENVLCWLKVETDGDVEDVVILPGDSGSEEDAVYYTVKRTINGATVRYLEKWATEAQCTGGTTVYEGASTATIEDLPYQDGTVVSVRNSAGSLIQNVTVSDGEITLSAAVTYARITPAIYRLADSFVTFNNAVASTTISGLDHLIGASVVVCRDGEVPEDSDGEPQTYTVNASGEIVVDEAALQGAVGLAYEAPWKSAKLGQALSRRARIDHLGLLLADVHVKGLKFGQTIDEDAMDPLPLMYQGRPVTENTVHSIWDDDPVEVRGEWNTNPRLCLLAKAPRPVTVLGALVSGEAGD